MILDFVACESDLSRRMGAWLDEHPAAALALVGLGVLLGGCVS